MQKPKQPPLEDRILAFREELETFVRDRCLELKGSQSGEGLPLEIIFQMLSGNSQCRCAVALKVIAERKKDEEIAARQQPAA
jgi:hypothetical protein